MRLKYKLIFTTALVLLLIGAASSALALDFGSGAVQKAASDAGFDPNTSETTFAETIGVIIYILLSFTGVIFLVLMVYAGWLWMTARGEEEPVEKAQKIIISSVIGFIILVGAYSITSFIVPRLTDVTGKDEGEKVICCQFCEDEEVGDECDYNITSIELCKNNCAGDTIGCKFDTQPLPSSNVSGVVCSAYLFSAK